MWTTIDEEGNEHLTKVHQVDCINQIFSDKQKQFVCKNSGELCEECCIYYSGLRDYFKDYEDLPTIGIEVDLKPSTGHKNEDERCFVSINENNELIDDDGLLDFLQTNIWNN